MKLKFLPRKLEFLPRKPLITKPKFHGRKCVVVARRGRERFGYGLCVLQILIFRKGASRKPSFW